MPKCKAPSSVQDFVAVMEEVVRASTGVPIHLEEKRIVPDLKVFQTYLSQDGPPPRL
jgi:hypothetical protein